MTRLRAHLTRPVSPLTYWVGIAVTNIVTAIVWSVRS